MKKTRLNKKSKAPVPLCKDRIQKLIRELAIRRDGGCVLRHYAEAGQCGGYGKVSGELILQGEHLNTRERNISFADMRNIVCLCLRHHGYFKPQESKLYWELIERHLDKKTWEWYQRVKADGKTYHMTLDDWIKIEIELKSQINHS